MLKYNLVLLVLLAISCGSSKYNKKINCKGGEIVIFESKNSEQISTLDYKIYEKGKLVIKNHTLTTIKEGFIPKFEIYFNKTKTKIVIIQVNNFEWDSCLLIHDFDSSENWPNFTLYDETLAIDDGKVKKKYLDIWHEVQKNNPKISNKIKKYVSDTFK